MEEEDEDYVPARNDKGQFTGCGNIRGRPRKAARKHRGPFHNAMAAVEVAEMPVKTTIDGKVVEMSAYSAGLRKVYQHGMANSDMRAMKMFFDHVASAATVIMEHSELVKLLISRDKEEQQLIADLLRYFPKPPGHGVYHKLEDGSVVPWQWAESIEKLKQLDQLEEKEKQLIARENALRAREELLKD